MKEMLQMENMYFEGIDDNLNTTKKSISIDTPNKKDNTKDEVDQSMMAFISNKFVNFRERIKNYYQNDQTSHQINDKSENSTHSEKDTKYSIDTEVTINSNQPSQIKQKSEKSETRPSKKCIFDTHFVNENGDVESFGRSSSSNSSHRSIESNNTVQSNARSTSNHQEVSKGSSENSSYQSPPDFFFRALV